MRQTMIRMLALLCVMAVFLGLTACHAPDSTQETQPALQQPDTQPTETEAPETKPTDPATTDPKPTQPNQTEPIVTDPASTEPEPTEPKPTTPPEEIEKMQQLFAPQFYNIYNYLLRTSFFRPEDALIVDLFVEGYQDAVCTVPTDAELAYLQGKLGRANLSEQKLVRIPAAYMDEVLQEHLGITSETANTRYLVYWEETDTYYYTYSSQDYYRTQITVTQVEHLPNGNIRVFYTDDTYDCYKVVTLQPHGDGYRVLSNIPERLLTDDPQLEALLALFDCHVGNQFYNDALLSDYATPADANLAWLFYDGFWDESGVATDAEAAFLDVNEGEDWIYMDLDRLPAKKMDAVLMEIFGITLEQTNRVGLEAYPYFEETDCYYHCHTGTHYADITITRVENCDDGTIRMYYERQGFPTVNMVATLKPDGDGYRILSNLPEDIASDDPEVAQMQLLFDSQYGDPFYNRALRSEYTTPADVDLYDLFYAGFEYEYRKPTNEELTLLEGKLHEYWKQVDLIRLPTSKMDKVLTEMFGLTLEQTNKVRLDEMAYLEETDCYYQAHYGDNLLDIAVQKVVHQADGTILVYYERTVYRGVWVVHLKLSGGKYQILSNLSEVEYMEPEKSAAWKIADKKIQLYELYKYTGIVCDFEHAGYEDMSRFLTEEQKKDYYDYQYLLLCCHTPEEVRAHIDQLVSKDENLGYPDKKLFTDDQGNLYVTVLPTGHSGYHCTKILEYSQDRIVATSEFWAYGISDAPEYLVTFTLDNIDGNFVITSIETEDWQED